MVRITSHSHTINKHTERFSDRKMEKKKGKFPHKMRFPNRECTREEFFHDYDNLRYAMKINLTNGQQASDINIGIDELVEFLYDVKYILESHNKKISNEEVESWHCSLGTDTNNYNDEKAREIERKIEEKAEEHNICLKKTVGLGGRGYEDKGHRLVSITYSFGSKKDGEKDDITDKHIHISKIEWVGGFRGKKEDLKESTLEITSVEEVNPTIYDKIKKYFGLA